MTRKASQYDYLRAIGIDVWRVRTTKAPAIEVAEVQPDAVVAQAEVETPVKSSTQEVDVTAFADMKWAELKETALNCKNCVLSQRRNKVVFGAGSETADLMFIGEGPGAEEDAQGLPFVGRAGQLLTSMIEALGFQREEVYIANVVKCRPPNNRDPSPGEAASCSPYLHRQIELISPKVIVALGRVSAQLLLKTDTPFGYLRGKEYKYSDTEINLVVTYHPAYLVRRLTEKKKAWDDLWRVKQMLQ